MPDTAGRGTRDAKRWTREAVFALPDDGNRYELIDAELVVTPSPRGVHQVAVSALETLLRNAIGGTGAGHVLHSPADITLGEDEVLQPDLFVYRTASGRHLLDWSDITALVLTERLHWNPAGGVQLDLDVASFFAEVWGE